MPTCQTSGRQKRTSWENKVEEALTSEWSKVTTSVLWGGMTTSQLLFSLLLMVHTQLTGLTGGTNPPSPTMKWEIHPIVKMYNRFTGGVDLLDSFTAKYKFHMREVHMLVFVHFLAHHHPWSNSTMTVETCRSLKRKLWTRGTSRNSWQPLSSKYPEERQTIHGWGKSRKPSHNAPPPDVRRDNVEHLPMKVEKSSCCRHCKDGYKSTAFIKCDVRLCLMHQKNCFLQFHT